MSVIDASELFRKTKVFNVFERLPVKELFNLRARIENSLPMPEYPRGTFVKDDLELLDTIIKLKIKNPT